MDTATFFIWAPRIFFAVMFAVIGVLAFRKNSINMKFTLVAVALYGIERILEIALRTYFTKLSLHEYDPSSFAYIRLESLIGPSLRAIISQQLIVIGIAFIVWLLLFWYAKKTNFQKLDRSDVLLFSFGTLIAGWPNFLIYIFLVFLFAAVGLTIQYMLKKNASRMIVTPYFAFAGVVVIFWGWELSKLVGLYAIR